MIQDAQEEHLRQDPAISATNAASLAPTISPRRSARLRRITASLELPAAIAVIAAVMSAIQFAGPAILDNDGYYHIRWAALLRESFPRLPAFRGLPLTTLDEPHYVDHHYLYHVLLFPFTRGDLRLGAKSAAVIFSSLGIGSMFALLWFHRIRFRWLWLAPLIAGSEPFLYRMSMTRAPALSLLLLALGTFVIFQRRLVLLAILSFAFVWSYSLFPLIVIFSCVHALTVYLSERRIDLWAPLVSTAAVIAGFVVNPYFPQNMRLFHEHLLMKATGEYPVDVGIEWYPYESFYMLTSSVVAFALFLLALIAFEYRDRVRDLKPLFFLIVTTLLLLMAIKSRRFMEYFPPFAVAFAAFTITPRLERLNYAWVRRTGDRILASVAAAVVTVVSVAVLVMTVVLARIEIKEETHPFTWKGASEYISQHAAPGCMVFNTNWDTFPALYYYNPDCSYVAGLDPTYLYDRDPDLWDLYESITNGQKADGAKLIRERFGAEYVVTGNGSSNFLTTANADPGFERVYEDSYAIVLRTRAPTQPNP